MQTDKLNPIGQVFSVLGYVANHPLELLGNSINLSDEDFVNDFHKVVFNAINNLAIDSKGETDEVTPLAVDVYLANYPKYYQIWKQNDGPQFLSDAKATESQFSFTHDYGLVKKFSVLRKYLSEGIDIKDIYDYDETNIEKVNDMNKRIEKMEVSEIVEHFTTKVINIRGDIELDNEDMVKFAASDDIESLLIRLNKEPVMGYPFQNPYYNTLFRGMQGGRFMLRSAASGGSKTRSAIRDMANASMSEFYDTENHHWVQNGGSVPTLFISTELNKDELQTILLAYVSGMTTAEIEAGNFSQTQRTILEHAVAIVKNSQMFFVYVEDFSTLDIQMIIEEYVIKYGVKFAVFDYIQNSPKLSKSFQDSFGHNLREDEILVELSRSIKNMAEKYDIFIISSTQLNSMADDDNIMVSRTGRALRGGSATVNKADYGIIMSKPKAIDIKRLQGLISEVPGFTEMPNFGHFIFKNRSGRSDMILWTKYDMGNMREKPLFITDFSYNLISDVPETKVNVNTYSASHEEVSF